MISQLLANRTKLLRRTAYLSCIAFSSSSFAMALKVDLLADQVTLEYQQPVRLEQVLRDTIEQSGATQPNRYPLANQLFDLEKIEQAQQLKNTVLQQLQVLASQGTITKESAGILLQQIKQWDIAYRQLVELDFDLVRTQAPSNPMLQGHYELITPKRLPILSFEGLLFSPQQVEFDSSIALTTYLNDLNLLSSAHPSYVWVIYPNGEYIRSGYSYWNNQNTQLTPGTTIFVGFNSEAKAIKRLEEQIVQLITMRRSTQ